MGKLDIVINATWFQWLVVLLWLAAAISLVTMGGLFVANNPITRSPDNTTDLTSNDRKKGVGMLVGGTLMISLLGSLGLYSLIA